MRRLTTAGGRERQPMAEPGRRRGFSFLVGHAAVFAIYTPTRNLIQREHLMIMRGCVELCGIEEALCKAVRGVG